MNLGGWIDDQNAVEAVMSELPFPVFGDVWGSTKDSGKGKIVLLYDIIEKVAGYFPLRKQAIGDCKKKSTLVVGPDDVKKVEDIKVGDRVYAGNGEITTVISTMCKKSYNPMVKIHTKGGLPLEVTSDHKVLVYQFGEFVNGNTKWRRRYSPGTQKAAIKARGENTQHKGNIVFAEREAKLIRASEITEADYLLCPVDIKFDTNIPEEMLPYMQNKELRWMVGLFLGDGCVPKKKKSQITWGCTTDEPEIEKRLCDVLDSMNIYWSAVNHCKNKSDKARIVRISRTEIARLFYKYFYNDEGYKVLPSWAINDDVIEGLLDADGHKYNQRQCFDNTSPSLVHGLRLWALTRGYAPTLNHRQRKDKRTGKVNKTSYTVSWGLDKTSRMLWRDEKYLAMPVTKIEVEEGPHEEVYDIGVEHDLHTFLDGCGATISNCVSMGTAYAVDAIKAVDIYIKKDFEEWVAETATEDIYGGSRVQIGKGRLGSGDGSVGAWAARYVNEYGALARKKYGDIDLTKYNPSVAKSWGMPNKGTPQDLIPFAKEHPVLTISQVSTYEQCRDLIANGYAVTICSNQGFSSKRDKDGFAAPQGNWAHCMSLLAVDDEYKRPGILVQNSWGVWNSGPKRHNQPDGSFWVDVEVLESRILSRKDSWAFSGYEGFKPQKINTRII